MSQISIYAKDYPIGKVFSDDFSFSVPFYQRPYAWTKEHAGELLDDLIGSMDTDGQSVEEMNPYFLGSIVLIKEENRPEAEILDGQQRLITITLLLATIRELIRERSPDISEELNEFIWERGGVLKGTSDRYRLTLRKKDVSFFKDYIQKDQGIERLGGIDPVQLKLPDSQKIIRENTLDFMERLGKLAPDYLVRLAKFTVLRCLLVVVTTPDLESAYRIFSVLNDRGLDLSLTDILKAEILGAIPDELQEEYASKWENIEDALGREKFENLFTYIRTIRRKVKTKETILKEIRQYVRPTENPREFIDRTLEECADVLMIITKSNYESTELAEEINSQLGLLNKIDNADWIPPAVDYFLRNKGATSTLLLFLTALEKLASGMMVYRANVNERIDRYAQILGWIQEEGKDILSTGSPLWLSREEKQKMYDTLNGDLYNNKPICSFVLQRLNSALPLEAGMAQSEKYPVISVEHVLPQNPKKGSEWERWFPTEEIRAHYTNRLGNLILLSRRKNSMAQNYEFSKKKERYFKIRGVSPFALTTTVINYNEWTPAIIENQQKFLLETLMGTWKY